MGQVNLREAFAAAWRVYKGNIGVLVRGHIIVFALLGVAEIAFAAALWMTNRLTDHSEISWLGFGVLVFVAVLTFFFWTPLWTGLVFLVRDCFEERPAKAATVFRGYALWDYTLIVNLIAAGLVLLGALACGVGALASFAITLFLIPLIVEGATPRDSLRQGWRALKANFIELMALQLALWLIAFAAILAVVAMRAALPAGPAKLMSGPAEVSIWFWELFALPFTVCVMWAAYRQVFPLAATTEAPPPSA